MKKIFFFCIGCLVIIGTLQVFLQFGGGVLGIERKIEARWYEYRSRVKHDPGLCADIGDYPGHGNKEYLRERCIARYAPFIQVKHDCGSDSLILSDVDIQSMNGAQFYRQECLINHYKLMLGNNLTTQWLPDRCSQIVGNLIVFSHYFKELSELVDTSENTNDGPSPLTTGDVETIEECEGLLNTSEIYTFLRGNFSPEEEAQYVETKKKKTEVQ